MNPKERIAVVTGGASGLGAATAHHLASLGAKVVVLDKVLSTDPELADAMVCDVTDPLSVEQCFDAITQTIGPVSICIQCAGIAPAAKIVSKNGPMALADFQSVIQVNLVGTFNVMRIALAKMQQRQLETGENERGVLINTASIAAFEGQVGQVAYSASKGGVVSMTLPAAREMAKWQIRVNAIAPGLMETPMLMSMPESVQVSLASTVPYPNRLGQPHEFALLCQQIIENAYLNGTVIRLDGALRMQA